MNVIATSATDNDCFKCFFIIYRQVKAIATSATDRFKCFLIIYRQVKAIAMSATDCFKCFLIIYRQVKAIATSAISADIPDQTIVGVTASSATSATNLDPFFSSKSCLVTVPLLSRKICKPANDSVRVNIANLARQD